MIYVAIIYLKNAMYATDNILDSSIAIVIILFMLSVIVEKITQLIRKYAPFLKSDEKSGKYAPSKFWQNIGKSKAGKGTATVRKIEREVNSLSLIIGIFIAAVFRVDLVRMFKVPDPRAVLFWDENEFYHNFGDYALLALSLGITGFFLTFGSKFFHDLLDVLYQTKSIKKKILDDNAYEAENIDQFDEYFSKSYTDLINLVIVRNPDLKALSGAVSPPMHGKMLDKGKWVDCIEIHVIQNALEHPKAVQLKLDKGQTISIPVNIIKVSGKPVALSAQGDSVICDNSPAVNGTICCKVKNKNDYTISLMTCSHVMTGGTAKNYFGELETPKPATFGDGIPGEFIWAACNSLFDLALLTTKDTDFEYKISPKEPKTLTSSDFHKPVKVVRQRGRAVSEGVINNVCVPLELEISYGQYTNSMINLIVLSNIGGTPDNPVYRTLTADGDSGSCVYQDGQPIGMIVAGNGEFSFAVSIIEALKITGTTLIK